MNVRSSAARRLSAVFLVALLAGCKTWEPVSLSPERLIADQRPSSVRITDVDGVEMTLRNPIVVNDSIVSSVAPVPGAQFQPPRVGVLSADVNSVETARVSTGKTILFIGAIAAASLGWARAASSSAGGRPEPIPPDPKGLSLSLLDGIRFVLGLAR